MLDNTKRSRFLASQTRRSSFFSFFQRSMCWGQDLKIHLQEMDPEEFTWQGRLCRSLIGVWIRLILFVDDCRLMFSFYNYYYYYWWSAIIMIILISSWRVWRRTRAWQTWLPTSSKTCSTGLKLICGWFMKTNIECPWVMFKQMHPFIFGVSLKHNF